MAEMDYRYAADCIRRHNLIHSKREEQAIFITKALDLAADVLERSSWIPCNERLPDNNRSVIARYNAMYADGIHKKYAVAFFSKFTGKWVEPLTGQHLDVDMWCEIPLESKPQEVNENDEL